ncbi:STAM-binding protein [Apodemus speciosus]|uniref:STAM-binding protein n=1 Tax=Apodemus speciosus TaxID=105296 RepID=A0ABQ0EX64_APOSI
MCGNLLNPRHSHQQSPGNKGPLCTGTTNVISRQLQIKNIPRHDDVRLLPQERFQLLSALGQNIEINKNFPLAVYMSLSKNLCKMAADLDQCGQKEAAFVLYHKFLTLYVEKLPMETNYKEFMEIFKRSNILKTIKQIFGRAEELKRELINQYSEEYLIYLKEKMKKEEEKLAKMASFWDEIRKTRTRSSKWASVPFLIRYGSQGKKQRWGGGTFSPTVVPLGKEARDEASPTTSPAAKEAAETGTLERPDQAGLELRNPPASASQVLGLQVCATTTGFKLFVYVVDYIDGFPYVEPSLDPWDEANLIMVDDQLYVEKLPMEKNYKEFMEIFKRSNILKTIKQIFGRAEELKRELMNQYSQDYLTYSTEKKKKEDEEMANNASLWKEKTKIRTRLTKWASFRFLKGNGSQEKKQGGEVGSGTTMSSKEAQPHSITTRTFSPTVVPSGKESQDEAAPTKSPAAKEAAETGAFESPVEKDRGLRPVVLPHDLCDKFLTAARMNTEKKIETCGVLCGALRSITLPIYSFLSRKEALIFAGPNMRGPLLYSRRTGASYLRMDTYYKQIGIFTLTPTGLKEISCCPRRGFHAHRQDTVIFCWGQEQDCSHVTTRNIMVTVTDLR